jgi:hypothetical protein
MENPEGCGLPKHLRLRDGWSSQLPLSGGEGMEAIARPIWDVLKLRRLV